VDAASAARKKDRTAEITLITDEVHAGYSRCGLPFVIGGEIPKFSDLIVYPSAYFQMLKLSLKTESKVTSINTKEKTVTYISKCGSPETLSYDALIIATGAYPFMPPIKGSDKKGILSLRTLEDGERIQAAVKAGVKSAVVMGAGLIGLETGACLIEQGLKVTVVEMLPQILPQFLDADMAKLVQEHLESKGMRILLGKCVDEFVGGDTVEAVIASGERIEADLFLNAFGVRANTKLAVEAGIPLGEAKAIKTNARMETESKTSTPSATARKPQTSTPQSHCAQLGTSQCAKAK
jgi:NADH oxidase (H2O2-forming)